MYGNKEISFNGEYFKFAMRTYKFKKHGHNKELFKNLVYGAAKFFNCNMIVPIPASEAGKESWLEKVFGRRINRLKNSTSRKYSHSKPVDYTGYVELAESVEGKDVLLVDDVVTTGKSILWYRNWLLAQGAQSVIPVGLGLNVNAATVCPTVEEAEAAITEAEAGERIKRPLAVLTIEPEPEEETETESGDEKSAYERHKRRADRGLFHLACQAAAQRPCGRRTEIHCRESAQAAHHSAKGRQRL